MLKRDRTSDPFLTFLLVTSLACGGCGGKGGDEDADVDVVTEMLTDGMDVPDAVTDTGPPPEEHGCTEGDIWVAPDGSDEAAGTEEEPLATLDAARDAVRAMIDAGLPEGGVTVVLREGIYTRSETLELGTEDSGEEGRPVTWCGYEGEDVRISGGIELDGADFTPVTDASAVWSRLDEAARGNVMQLDLTAHVADLGTVTDRASSSWSGGTNHALELIYRTRPMELARWPDRVEAADYDFDIASVDIEASSASPDVSGVYVPEGEYNGRTYYKHPTMDWFVYFNTNGHYYLSNSSALGGDGGIAWWSRWGSTPFGPYAPDGSTSSGTPWGETGKDDGFARVDGAVSDTSFTYDGTRPGRWSGADEVMALGFWEHMWHSSHEQLTDIDTSSSTITLTDNPYSMAERQPWFAYNLVEEITVAGEYHVDRSTGMLTFWPPDDLSGEMTVSVLDDDLLRLAGASHVTLRAITFENGRGDLVVMDGGTDNLVLGCEVRNAGSDGIVITGTRSGVYGCHVHHTGASCIRLSGGDRYTLERGENFVENTHIHHFGRTFPSYHHGIYMVDGSGNQRDCGNRVAHNQIHDGPHAGILFRGNEHAIEYNEIYHVCEWASDMGAVYTGRDWGYHGNSVRFNFIHHLRSPLGVAQHGVYLDDCASGVHVFGNVLYSASPSSAILHGGGRDTFIENNIVVGSTFALHVDNRGRTAIRDDGSSWDLLAKLVEMSYQDDPWASAYPTVAAIPADWSTLESSHWLDPEGSVFARNLGFRLDGWIKANSSAGVDPETCYTDMDGNVEDADPLFTDESTLDLSLQPGSPVEYIDGWVHIPFDEIGIQ